MSIFGKMDAATIPTNPFFIEKGEYTAEITKGLYKENRDGQKQLIIEYTIRDDDSQYVGSKATQYFNIVDSEMTEESFALLPADEQKKIRQTNASIKKTLCGNDRNEKQPGLGVSVEDLNSEDPEWDPATLVGKMVNIAIDNWGTDGVNVKWANIIQ